MNPKDTKNESKITVPNQLMERLLKAFPELKIETKQTQLRIGLHKLLLEKESKKIGYIKNVKGEVKK